MCAGSIYFTIANNGYQSDWVGSGVLGCCSNTTGAASCGSSSGITVSGFQNVTIASETSYQYIFNISESPAADLRLGCLTARRYGLCAHAALEPQRHSDALLALIWCMSMLYLGTTRPLQCITVTAALNTIKGKHEILITRNENPLQQ